jgi:hypothetical protein
MLYDEPAISWYRDEWHEFGWYFAIDDAASGKRLSEFLVRVDPDLDLKGCRGTH